MNLYEWLCRVKVACEVDVLVSQSGYEVYGSQIFRPVLSVFTKKEMVAPPAEFGARVRRSAYGFPPRVRHRAWKRDSYLKCNIAVVPAQLTTTPSGFASAYFQTASVASYKGDTLLAANPAFFQLSGAPVYPILPLADGYPWDKTDPLYNYYLALYEKTWARRTKPERILVGEWRYSGAWWYFFGYSGYTAHLKMDGETVIPLVPIGGTLEVGQAVVRIKIEHV